MNTSERMKNQSVEEIDRARGQLEFMGVAITKLGDCAPEEIPGLEAERDRRFNNAKEHAKLAADSFFFGGVCVERCWNVVRPDAAHFSSLLPQIVTEVAKVVTYPGLDDVIAAALQGGLARWTDTTTREERGPEQQPMG